MYIEGHIYGSKVSQNESYKMHFPLLNQLKNMRQ